MFIFFLWSDGNKKPATALAIAGFGKIFSFICLCFHSHDAKLTGLMLPTGQTPIGRHGHLDLFGERRVHFVADKKPYLPPFVNGIMEEHFEQSIFPIVRLEVGVKLNSLT